jgi:hypothetical protein
VAHIATGETGLLFNPLTESGYLACHRIVREGNSGPDPGLTQVGSALSTPRIEQAIITPNEPMPPFRRLPKAKLDALVEFLSLLRR